MEFRKASMGDFPKVLRLYSDATTHMHDNGIDQWDEHYPDADILREDIQQGNMYLCIIHDDIAAAVALSTEHEIEYNQGAWRYPDSAYTVVHRLCVSPGHQGAGVASKTMVFLETLAREGAFDCIRLDAFSHNPAALRLYEKLGYTKVGEIPFQKGEFFLFEKKI